MNICTFGLNHKTAPIEIREKFSLPNDAIALFLKDVNKYSSATEALFLSTCNRSELYLVTKYPEKIKLELEPLIKQHFTSDFSLEAYDNYFYFFKDIEAINHLFLVASSLDSMVLGENEILGQVKEAFRNASEIYNTTGKLLNKLFQFSFCCAKKVKADTQISSIPISLGHIAVEMAKKSHPDMHSARLLLIGCGEIGSSVLKYLITLINIAFETARKKVENLGLENINIVGFDELQDELKKSDVIICSANSKSYLIKPQMFEDIDPAKCKVIIDIGMPRNVDPNIHEIKNIALFDIDNLEKIKDNSYQQRVEEAKKAKKIISTFVADYVEWIHVSKMAPIIDSIKNQLENIRKDELNNIYTNHLKHLKSIEKEQLDNVTSAIVKKISNYLIPAVKEKAISHKNKDELETFIKTISDLFKIE